jgi:hypothetical protein
MKPLVALSLFVIAASTLAGSAAQAESTLLEGDALRDAVSGGTVYVATPIGALPIHYAANGTMSASGPEEMVSLAGEEVRSDRGKWWINGAQLCQRWQNWQERQSFCYEMRKQRGNTVHWTRNDGQTGTARISRPVYRASAAE